MKSNAVKIVAIVLAVLAAASAVAFFATKEKTDAPLGVEISDAPTQIYSYESSAYSAKLLGANGEIFLPTDIDGIYYTADLSGNITFYEYTNGTMAVSTLAPKEIATKIKATFESIPLTVKYIEKDGKVCGYGVFTSDMDEKVEVYPYAFVKLINKPAGYGEGHLLLADFEKDNFYNPDKIYSEIYNFNIANGSASTYVSMNTRLTGPDGALRNDWTMLTDDFVANLGDAKYFLSSRYYTSDDRGRRADVMVLSNAYRPQIAVEDILGLWFVNDANGMHYLKKTDKGFDNILNVNNAEQVLTSFEGDYFEDYLQNGRYLINKKSLVMTDLMTGATKTLKDVNIEKADFFTVNPDGTKAVFGFNGKENAHGVKIQTLVYSTVDGSAEPAVFCEPLLFNESCGFVWLDNSTVMSARALSGDGAKTGSVVYAF